jgi:hypothetical protein
MDKAPDALLDVGSVVVVGSDGLVHPSNSSLDKRVVGVVTGIASSAKTAFIAAVQKWNFSRHVYVAVAGIAECNVVGPVDAGDGLTTAPGLGYAMATPRQVTHVGTLASPGSSTDPGGWVPGYMLGKALASVPLGVTTRIPILVSLG